MLKILLLALMGLALCMTLAHADGPNPLGKKLPSITGQSLSEKAVRLPDDVTGSPAVLLVAYRRGTQEDVDRWMAFLNEKAPGLSFYEVPTIAGILWRPMAGWIDSGMRRGVPQEKWPKVVTVYGDASVLRDFLGDYGGYTTHVVLLDGEGKVAWFNAGGFSERSAETFLSALGCITAKSAT
jgi:hypothetical protein